MNQQNSETLERKRDRETEREKCEGKSDS